MSPFDIVFLVALIIWALVFGPRDVKYVVNFLRTWWTDKGQHWYYGDPPINVKSGDTLIMHFTKDLQTGEISRPVDAPPLKGTWIDKMGDATYAVGTFRD